MFCSFIPHLWTLCVFATIVDHSSANASSAGDDIANAANASDPMTLALHKSWGQKEMTVTRGQSVKKVEDDFVLYLDQLNGDSELAYTL